MSRRAKASTLMLIVGTRPNFMKAASIMAAIERRNETCAANSRIRQVLVHTGQHYDDKMSEVFFRDLGLPRPDHYLGVGSGTHAEQTAKVMLTLEPVMESERPDLVMVVGDVNSTLAATLVASKLKVPVAHVEAGLRSRDRSMPEELNRLATDQLAELLFTSSRDADANLVVEGIPEDRIFFAGNTMIDTLDAHLGKARESEVVPSLGLTPGRYVVATLHRPSNVDDPDDLKRLARVLTWVSQKMPVVFPVHARTKANLEQVLAESRSDRRRPAAGAHNGDSPGDRRRTGTNQARAGRLLLIDPLGYLDFLSLTAQARLVITDSGGIQEETTVLGVPCLTLRTSTERPITIWEGTNRLVDPFDDVAIMAAVQTALLTPTRQERRPERWDGLAGERIVKVTAQWFDNQRELANLRQQKVAV
jgi:UDP-N-acetylglucosamine 2-epimerase (non-hydrolysing)